MKRFISLCIAFLLVMLRIPIRTEALSNEVVIYNFLKETMGLNTAAACGVLANIERESSFRADIVEYGYTWETGGGYGICQWTNSPRTSETGRRTDLVNYCAENGYDYTTLEGQLNYLYHEMQTTEAYTGTLPYLRGLTDDTGGAYAAGYYYCYYYERPASKELGAISRGELAVNTYWKRYGGPITDLPIQIRATPDENEITQTNAVLFGVAEKPAAAAISHTGIYLWADGSSKKQSYSKKTTETGVDSTTFAVSLDLNDAGWTLEPGTVYWYQLLVKSNSVGYLSLAVSFTAADPVLYDVTYDANGGTGAPDGQTKIDKTALTLSGDVPEREGYVFLGWSGYADATFPAYLPGGKYTANASAVLYAVWQSAETPFLRGDVNGDGKIAAADARLTLRASLGKLTLSALSEYAQTAADADDNGDITAADARLILRASLGKLHRLPVENTESG